MPRPRRCCRRRRPISALAVAAIERASHMESEEAAFFNEGIFQAAEQLTKGKNPSSRRVIIWLTDDVPNLPSERDVPPWHRRSMPMDEAAFPTGRAKTSSTNIDRGLLTGQEERAVCGRRIKADVKASGKNAASSR